MFPRKHIQTASAWCDDCQHAETSHGNGHGRGRSMVQLTIDLGLPSDRNCVSCIIDTLRRHTCFVKTMADKY